MLLHEKSNFRSVVSAYGPGSTVAGCCDNGSNGRSYLTRAVSPDPSPLVMPDKQF